MRGFLLVNYNISLSLLGRDLELVEEDFLKYLTLGSLATLDLSGKIVSYLPWIFALVVVIPISSVFIYQVASRNFPFYSTYELLTGVRFSKAILGMVFGSLLGSWMTRAYRMDRKGESKMLLSQKVEGFALVFLFIFGASSLTVDEILRSLSLSYGKDGLAFQLASSGQSPAAGELNGADLALPAVPTDSRSLADQDNPRERTGMQVLTVLDDLMMRDYRNIKPNYIMLQ